MNGKYLIAPRLLISHVTMGAYLFLSMVPARSEEPYKRFLEKLRDEQMYDLALVYLNDLNSRSAVDAGFKSEIQLEEGLLMYQAAALMPASNPERAQKLDAAEEVLRQFLETRQQHPRRGEARLKLGELLLTRAEEAKRRAGEAAVGDVDEAIRFYNEAHLLFEATVSELAKIFETIKGARTDASDTTQVAYRNQLQQDLRQAQLLSAKAVEERGRSRAIDSPQRQADLKQALSMFSELYSKEQRMVGIRNYALFYRSSIQATLGLADDAIDGFQRIADVENVDVLRPLQTNAVAQLLKQLAEQQKFSVAIDRADQWLGNLRPDERHAPETMDLRLELARARILWAQSLSANDPSDRVASRLLRDTRSDLSSMIRIPGMHAEPARELLSQLGIEKSEKPTTELPPVKDISEALAAAQERIDRADTQSLGVEKLKLEASNSQTAGDRQQELKQIIAATTQTIESEQQQALELLRTGLRLYTPADDRTVLFDVRLRLAFVYLKQQRPWDALVVAEFLARSNPKSEQGLRAAAIALGGYSDLLRSAGPEKKVELTNQLEPFAQFLVNTWPQSSEASAAASALVQLALINKQWEQAEQFLGLVQGSGETLGRLRRDAGIAFYARYLQDKKEAGEENANTSQLRSKAIHWLKIGTQDLTAEQLDSASVDAINALARLLLADKQVQEAGKVLFDNANSPLKAIKQQPDLVAVKTSMETYRTAVQVTSSRVAEGQLPADVAAEQMRSYIDRLQTLSTQDAEGPPMLASIFVGLARDLKEQLTDLTDAAKRRQMAEVLVLVAAQAAKSDSFNTRHWAADTILSLAEDLQENAASAAQASVAFSQAESILLDMLAREKASPGWIDPAGAKIQVQLKLAKAKRGTGDYKSAIDALATILQTNSGLLDVQIEAALGYKAWGAQDARLYKAAIAGGRPDPKSGQKLIWGFGKISQLTADKADFAEQFYLARYELALCRLRYAMSLQDIQLKADELGRAEKDIESTARLYPELGGAARKKKFDVLLQSVQKALNKTPVGLAALDK